MNAFEYLEPNSVAEAVRMLAEYGTRARVLAGGTDLLIQMEGGKYHPQAVISLSRVPELRQIVVGADGGLRIGAAATLRAVETHPVVREQYPALARGAQEVGSVQIRNLATLAGNLCNASPSADTSPALLVYDAEVEIVGRSGASRVLTVSQFWLGPGRTSLQPDELVAAVRLPSPPPGLRSVFYKLAVRKAMDLAMVGVAVAAVPGCRPGCPLGGTRGGTRGDGGATHARIALGAVGPVCFRARDAEVEIERGGAAAIDRAAALAEAAASPIDDQRASAAYRREMVRVLTARGLREILAG